jgi:hypothetical protein
MNNYPGNFHVTIYKCHCVNPFLCFEKLNDK